MRPSLPSRMLPSETKMPAGLSCKSLLTLLTRHQHPDQQANHEGHSDRFVRMGADHFVGGFGPFDRLLFQAATSGFCGLKCLRQTFTEIVSLVAHCSC